MKTKKMISMMLIASLLTLSLYGQNVSLSTNATIIGGNVTAYWSGFSGNVNVIFEEVGGTFITYASTNVPGNSSQVLTMTDAAIGTGYHLTVGSYCVKVELRSNTNINATACCSVSDPVVSITPSSANYGDNVQLTWSGFASNVNLKFYDVNGFVTYANTDVSGSGQQSMTLTDAAIGVPGYHLQTSSGYYVYVELRANTAVNENSNNFTITVPSLAAPTNLTATAQSSSSIQLSWSAVASATSYDIYSCSGNYLATVYGTNYLVSSLLSNTYYSYKIKAVNSFTSSAFSTCAGATTLQAITYHIDLSSTSRNVNSSAGTFVITVNSSSNTSWSAVSNQPWLSVAPGAGYANLSTYVTLTYSSNQSGNSRVGIIQFTGSGVSQIFTLTQSANNTNNNSTFQLSYNDTSHLYWPFYNAIYNNSSNPVSSWSNRAGWMSGREWQVTHPGDDSWGSTWNQNFHVGHDYYADDWNNHTHQDCGMNLYSPVRGRCVLSYYSSSYGNCIAVQLSDDTNFVILFAHLSHRYIQVNQNVNVYDLIGAIGSTGNSTGCHLHVALYKNTPHPFSFSQMTSANAAKFEFDAVYIPNGQKIFVSNSGNDLTGDGSSQNPYYSVQKAVNIATENDSIMIDNGTYTPVVFNGHDVTLVGKGENNTFIDGVNASSCLSILSGETIKIYGMTLQNGNSMNGGAVNIEWGGSCYADSCIIKNSTGQYGGGVSVNNGVFSITNSEIKNNTAIYGGGINAHNNSRIFAQNCKINDNIATTTSISVNTSGGGITCYIGSSAVLINCLGHHNIADYGAFYHGNNSCGLTLINSTISLNRTNKDAAAIEIIDSTMCDIQSSVIWDNHPRQIILSGWNSPRISCASIDYTAIKAGYSGIITNGNILNYGTSNLTSDPLFQDTTALDFTLQPSSPCINSASPDSCENLTQFDLSGNNREIDSYIDRGCYESLISITTGVNDEMKNDRDAIIFPNPSNGDFTITDNIISLEISDNTGKCIVLNSPKVHNENATKITCSGILKPGIYFVKASKEDGAVFNKKLVVIK